MTAVPPACSIAAVANVVSVRAVGVVSSSQVPVSNASVGSGSAAQPTV